jgi:hypothetical protein
VEKCDALGERRHSVVPALDLRLTDLLPMPHRSVKIDACVDIGGWCALIARELFFRGNIHASGSCASTD